MYYRYRMKVRLRQAAARKTYDEATATAGKSYDEAMAAAGKSFDEAMATAGKTYDDAIEFLDSEVVSIEQTDATPYLDHPYNEPDAQPVVEAARELLNNLIDSDEHGPELGCDKNKYPLDQAGDPWYSDCWKLYQAFNIYDAKGDGNHLNAPPSAPGITARPRLPVAGELEEKTMSKKHSPTPWTQCGMNVIGADHTVVCTVNRPPGDNTADPFRNQEFIVRAVNCHKELLAACKQMVIEAGRDGSLRDVVGYKVLVENYVMPVIAKAEGRTTL